MKKLCLMLILVSFLACDKEDEGITMKPENLTGTYWKQTQWKSYEYHDGKLTDTFKNNFDGSIDGGGGPTILFFKDEATMTEYHTLSPTGYLPTSYYKIRTYLFEPTDKSFRTLDPSGTLDEEWMLETFTSDKIVRSSSGEYTQGSEKYLVRERETYRRFRPDEEWLRGAAQYPNYDEIDWPQHQ